MQKIAREIINVTKIQKLWNFSHFNFRVHIFARHPDTWRTQLMKYTVCIALSSGAVWAEPSECKTCLSPTCLSIFLSVVSVPQLDRQDRRSSTFTLPACKTSRGVLMNEVAISYCSLKRVLKWICVCANRRRERQVSGRIRLLHRKDELEKD